MPSSGANTQSIDGILKDYYEDFVSENVNNRNPLKDLFRFETMEYGGREVVYTSHVSRNVSPMFVGEDSAFADAGVQGHVQVRVGQNKLMGRIRLTYEAMHDSMSSKAAFKQARKDENEGLVNDLARRIEYALCTDGRGVLGLVDESTPSGDTTLEMDAPGGITNDNFGNRFVLKNMYVGFVNPATGALRTGVRQVTAVNADGTDITLSSAPDASVANSDYVVQVANSSVTDVLDSSYEHAFWGMVAHIDDGTYRNNYFGVDRSVYGNFQSYVKAATGALSIDVLQQVSDVLDQKLNSKVDCLLAHHSTRRLYLALLEGDRRYTAQNLQQPDGGTVAFQQGDITIGEVPIKPIRDFPLDMMMLLDKAQSGWICYQSEPGKWVDEDGQILVRVGTGSSGRDSFEAWYRMRKQFHCRYPGYNARLDGITGQTLIVVRAE
jgi:hypothetical protein